MASCVVRIARFTSPTFEHKCFRFSETSQAEQDIQRITRLFREFWIACEGFLPIMQRRKMIARLQGDLRLVYQVAFVELQPLPILFLKGFERRAGLCDAPSMPEGRLELRSSAG